MNPHDGKTAIIICTLWRHDRLPSIVTNLISTTNEPFRIYFVVEDNDDKTISMVNEMRRLDPSYVFLMVIGGAEYGFWFICYAAWGVKIGAFQKES